MPVHTCPSGPKTVALLRRRRYTVDDRWLRSPEAVDAFKAEHCVATAMQAFVDGTCIGGYRPAPLARPDVAEPKALTDRPVAALFGVAALMALSVAHATGGPLIGAATVQGCTAFARCLLAMLKLRDVAAFPTMFIDCGLLAQSRVPYGCVYPCAGLTADMLMAAGALPWLSIPLALTIGGIGAVSVVKAVYVERRELECACVGGDTNVPLGIVSLTETLMTIRMAVWMLFDPGGPGAAH